MKAPSAHPWLVLAGTATLAFIAGFFAGTADDGDTTALPEWVAALGGWAAAGSVILGILAFRRLVRDAESREESARERAAGRLLDLKRDATDWLETLDGLEDVFRRARSLALSVSSPPDILDQAGLVPAEDGEVLAEKAEKLLPRVQLAANQAERTHFPRPRDESLPVMAHAIRDGFLEGANSLQGIALLAGKLAKRKRDDGLLARMAHRWRDLEAPEVPGVDTFSRIPLKQGIVRYIALLDDEIARRR